MSGCQISVEQGVEYEREIRADELRADDRLLGFGDVITVEVIEGVSPETDGRMVVGGWDAGRCMSQWHELRLRPESPVTVRCPRACEAAL